MVFKYDFLIIGAGVAGMSYALKIARAHKGKVCMICKTTLEEANTSFAQGGVASVTNLEVDNFDKHIEDTIIAGDYISDRRAVEQVVRNAPAQIRELVSWGVNFDKKADGEYDLHREGGHSERSNPDIEIKENHFAVEIITQHHLGVRVTRRSPHIQCYGAYVLNPDTQKVDTYLSKVTLMCTGGCGAVYQATTNPVIPLRSTTRAKPIPPSSSPRPCGATAECCACPTAARSWRNTTSACRWRRATSLQGR